VGYGRVRYLVTGSKVLYVDTISLRWYGRGTWLLIRSEKLGTLTVRIPLVRNSLQ
jgi:hypothetical protein